MKIAAIPIPIDKNFAKKLVQKFVSGLPAQLKKFYLNSEDYSTPLKSQREFNSETWVWRLGDFIGSSVTEDYITIPVFVKARPPTGMLQYMAGGVLRASHTHPKSQGKPLSLTLFINENITFEKVSSDTSRIYKEAYSVLIHEMTHALDYLRNQGKLDIKQYYNSPTEVRAFMQQIVDEVLEATEKMIKMTDGWGSFQSSDFFWEIMYSSSPTWDKIKRNLTDKNKKLILKAVARALSDHVPGWLKPYYQEDLVKEANMKSYAKIGRVPYVMSKYNGWGEDNPRSPYLWVLDIDKKFLSMWVAKEGNEKYAQSSNTAERALRELERRKELNRVSHEEYLKIERAMNKRAEEVYRELQRSIRDQESQAERNFREVANLYFDRIIAQFFHELYLKYKGTHPLTFKYRPESRFSRERQLAYWVLEQVISKYWTEDNIFKYRERIWSPSNSLSLEGLGDQDPYFIMTDILPDKIEEFFDQQKIARKRRK